VDRRLLGAGPHRRGLSAKTYLCAPQICKRQHIVIAEQWPPAPAVRRLRSLPAAEEASIDRLRPSERHSLLLLLLLVGNLLATMAAASGLGAGARRRAYIAARAALRREGARVARAERRRAGPLVLTAAGRQWPRVSDTARAPASIARSAVRSAHLSAARIRVRARPLIGSVRLQSSSIDSTTS